MTQAILRRRRLPIQQNDNVSIYIRNYAKKAITMSVSPKLKTQFLKQHIKRKMKVLEEDQALFINGVKIEDDIEEIQVQNRLIIHLVNLKRVGLERMTISVRRPIDKSPIFKYNVKSGMKIADFFKDLLVSDFQDIENYFLVYTCRELMAYNTFTSEYVEDQSEIMCVHKIQDRKSQIVELRRMPAAGENLQRTPQINMIRKRKNQQNSTEKDSESMVESKYIKIGQINNIKHQQKQQIMASEDIEKQALNKQNQNKIQEAKQQNNIQNQIDKAKQNDEQKKIEAEVNHNQSNNNNQNDDNNQSLQNTNNGGEDFEEITITNKQQYAVITKGNLGSQNKNVRKKMRSNFAAPQPLHQDEHEQEQQQQHDKNSQRQQQSCSQHARENTHLGLTVISSRHDEQESIEPNQVDYRHMMNMSIKQDRESMGINRTYSEPLKLMSGSQQAENQVQVQKIAELPQEEEKKSEIQANYSRNSANSANSAVQNISQNKIGNDQDKQNTDNDQQIQQSQSVLPSLNIGDASNADNKQQNADNLDNENITVTEVEVEVCKQVNKPEQPQMNYDGAEQQYGMNADLLDDFAYEKKQELQQQIIVEKGTVQQLQIPGQNIQQQERDDVYNKEEHGHMQDVETAIKQQIQLSNFPVLKTQSSSEYKDFMNQRLPAVTRSTPTRPTSTQISYQQIQDQILRPQQMQTQQTDNIDNQDKKIQTERIIIKMDNDQTYEIKDLQNTRPLHAAPRIYNNDDSNGQGQQTGNIVGKDVNIQQNMHKNDDQQQNIRPEFITQLQTQEVIATSQPQKVCEVESVNNSAKKRVKSDTDSLLLDNSAEIIQSSQSMFSQRFGWKNMRDDKNLIDMSAQLQEQGLDINEIIPGNNIKNWDKLSFSFRNNEAGDFKAGDLIMLGNAHSLGMEHIRDEIYAEFEEKLMELQSNQQ